MKTTTKKVTREKPEKTLLLPQLRKLEPSKNAEKGNSEIVNLVKANSGDCYVKSDG
jgi:hypothetical protein